MKKLITICITLSAFVSVGFAAETIAVTKDEIREFGDTSVREISITLTGDGDGTLDDLDLLPSLTNMRGDLTGWMAWFIEVYPGGTAPTDAADLTMLSCTGADMLGGSGTDKIDATSKTTAECFIGGTASRPTSEALRLAKP